MSPGLAKALLLNTQAPAFYKEVIPGVQAMARPGDTNGHTAFVINSGSQTLFVAGDLVVHHYAVSLSVGGSRSRGCREAQLLFRHQIS